MKKIISMLLTITLLITSVLCIGVGAQNDYAANYNVNAAEKSFEAAKQLVRKNAFEKMSKNVSDKVISAVSLSDINDHWSKTEVSTLVDMGIINGYPDGTFLPDNTITRAEFTKIIIETMMTEGGFEYSTDTNTFADVKPTEWFSKQVETAYKYEIVNGVDESHFDPEGLITREEAAKIISCVFIKLCGYSVDYLQYLPKADLVSLGFRDVSKISDWAYDYMAMAVYYGFINGSDNLLTPADPMTRAEASAVIYRLFELNKKPADVMKVKVSDFLEFLDVWFEYNEYDFRVKTTAYNAEEDYNTVVFSDDKEYVTIANCSYTILYRTETINGEEYIKHISLYNEANAAMDDNDFYAFLMMKSGIFACVTANTGIKLYDDIFITNCLKFTDSFDTNCFMDVNEEYNYKDIFTAYYDSYAPTAENNNSTSAVLSVYFN